MAWATTDSSKKRTQDIISPRPTLPQILKLPEKRQFLPSSLLTIAASALSVQGHRRNSVFLSKRAECYEIEDAFNFVSFALPNQEISMIFFLFKGLFRGN